MKRSWKIIGALVGLCVIIALIAFFLPNHNGAVLSYLTISLAAMICVLCVGGMVHFYTHSE